MVRAWHSRVAAAAVLGLSVAFYVLICIGMSLPCMELRLDMDLLYEVKPDLKALSGLIDGLGLPVLLHTTVSVQGAIQSLTRWALNGEVNSVIALFMFGVLVVAFSALDVLSMLLSAFIAQFVGSPWACRARRILCGVSGVLRKLCMLDVSLVGIFLVVLTLRNLRDHGVILDLRQGAFVLLGAEACRYLAMLAAGHLAEVIDEPAAGLRPVVGKKSEKDVGCGGE